MSRMSAEPTTSGRYSAKCGGEQQHHASSNGPSPGTFNAAMNARMAGRSHSKKLSKRKRRSQANRARGEKEESFSCTLVQTPKTRITLYDQHALATPHTNSLTSAAAADAKQFVCGLASPC